VIDFRYHLVSIVAVFLALAIGIVLGSTELQGGTLDALKNINDSLTNQLNAVIAERDSYGQSASASDTFLATAEPKLLADMLTGDRIVLVTEPGAPSSVISGIQTAAKDAGATITGTIALQPKFNDLSGTTRASLYAVNAPLASSDGIQLQPATDTLTVYQQNAAQLIAAAILEKTGGQPELAGLDAQTLLKQYENAGYLSVSSGTPTDGASLAVIVTPPATSADGPNDPADEILPAVAAQFALVSAATLVAGPVAGSTTSSSPISVLRSSSAAAQVSSVDNADTTLGQISTIWALADQLQGGKPNSYGISGASAVSPSVPLPVPSVTPTVPATPTTKATGKVTKTVNTK
jgi:Copper transport outer membrane protein, MctB